MNVQLPRHDDAEQSVLGAVFARPQALFDVAGRLQVEHFAHPHHRRIYAAMLAMTAANRPIDEVALFHELGAEKDDIGRPFVYGLREGVPSSLNITYYADLVINAAKLRGAVLQAMDVITAATGASAKADEIIEKAQAAYFNLTDHGGKKTLFWADEMTAELLSEMERAHAGGPEIPPVKVGLPSIDALFNGFAPGDFGLLAGRPSTGKTALANQIGLLTAGEGTVLVCSMEMKHSAVWKRALANFARVSMPTYQSRKFSESEQRSIGAAAAKLGALSLAIEDLPKATDMQILATARRIQMQRGLRLIIVDYLQLMRSAEKFTNRHQELESITRSLKEIAMQLDVPILALAALSRAATKERPNMSHIRECGSAEYDADHIFLMHRDVDEQKDLQPGQPSPAELIVEKQRNGATGSIPLLYFGEFYRFESQALS